MDFGEIGTLIGEALGIVQVAVLIFVAWLSHILVKKIALPDVLGYILAGILIGPYALGSLSLGSILPLGLFPSTPQEIISPQLQFLSAIAIIVMLFYAGLETEIDLLLRYAFRGSMIGLGGLVFSFGAGYLTSVLFHPQLPGFHPYHLLFGTIFGATSVGISASILSQKRAMGTPEGVTIISAAVFDDVLGIIILSITTSIAMLFLNPTTEGTNATATSIPVLQLVITSLRALVLWISFTTFGILLSNKFSNSMKKIVKGRTQIAVMSLCFALLLGGVFEALGISMVIGAYIIGLSLSRTDIAYLIQDKLRAVNIFLVPIFFITSGMRIDVISLLSWRIMGIGLLASILAFASKFFGAGIPALGFGFTIRGATRIGLGMTPRGEVALVVAGIGLSLGILSAEFYNVALMVVLFTSIVTPPLLSLSLNSKKQGTKKAKPTGQVLTTIALEDNQIFKTILAKFFSIMEEEGFYISKIRQSGKEIFYLRKDLIFLTLEPKDTELQFHSTKDNIPIFKAALLESITDIAESAHAIKTTISRKTFINTSSEIKDKTKTLLHTFYDESLVCLSLKGTNKKEVMHELIDLIDAHSPFTDKDTFTRDLIERENTMSTGLEHGIAIPHAKSKGCTIPRIAVGIKKEGLDFDSLDEKPSTIIVLIASPIDGMHLEIISKVSSILNNAEKRKKILDATTTQEVYRILL